MPTASCVVKIRTGFRDWSFDFWYLDNQISSFQTPFVYWRSFQYLFID